MPYGVEFYNQFGLNAIESDETFNRVVHVETKPDNFNGSFSVPKFDENKGMFFVRFRTHRVRLYLGSLYPYDETSTWTPPGAAYISFDPFALPSLIWNNITKTMTCAPHSNPPGFGSPSGTISEYQIIFLHYR